MKIKDYDTSAELILPRPLIQTRNLPHRHKMLLSRMKNRGEIQQVASGVYIRVQHWEQLSFKDKADAMSAAAIGSLKTRGNRLLAGRSAASVIGMPLVGKAPIRTAEVVANRTSRSKFIIPHSLTKHGTTTQVHTKFGTLPATDPLTTSIDLGLWHGLDHCVVAAEWCLRNKIFTKQDFIDRVDLLKGVPGVGIVRDACRLINTFSESPRESEWKVKMFEAGMPAPFQQVNLYDEYGTFLGRVDFFWMNGVVGEYDGQEKYYREDPVRYAFAVEQERERERALLAAGCILVRSDRHSFQDGSDIRRLMALHNHLDAKSIRFPFQQVEGGGLAWS